MTAEVAHMLKKPENRKVVYKGDGRYEILIEDKRNAGQALNMEYFSVTTSKDGIITISGIEIKEKIENFSLS